jgi:hypothetical protein
MPRRAPFGAIALTQYVPQYTNHSLYLERFIHSELYKARGDVNAIN